MIADLYLPPKSALLVPQKPAIIRAARLPQTPAEARGIRIVPPLMIGLGGSFASLLTGEKAKALVLIDRTTGTNIGNMTESGGLAAAFDGNTNQVAGSSAEHTGSWPSWIGKTLVAPKIFGRAEIYGSNNQGIIRDANPSTTVNIRGKNGTAPASGTDGTIVGTATFTDSSTNTKRTVDSSDLSNAWDHLFLEIPNPGSGGGGSIGELVLYEWA